MPDTKLTADICTNTEHEHRTVEGYTICDITAVYWRS